MRLTEGGCIEQYLFARLLRAKEGDTVTGHNTIPKNGQIEFPTLTDGVRVNDNSLDSPVVEEDAAHGTSGGTIHDSGAFS